MTYPTILPDSEISRDLNNRASTQDNPFNSVVEEWDHRDQFNLDVARPRSEDALSILSSIGNDDPDEPQSQMPQPQPQSPSPQSLDDEQEYPTRTAPMSQPVPPPPSTPRNLFVGDVPAEAAGSMLRLPQVGLDRSSTSRDSVRPLEIGKGINTISDQAAPITEPLIGATTRLAKDTKNAITDFKDEFIPDFAQNVREGWELSNTGIAPPDRPANSIDKAIGGAANLFGWGSPDDYNTPAGLARSIKNKSRVEQGLAPISTPIGDESMKNASVMDTARPFLDAMQLTPIFGEQVGNLAFNAAQELTERTGVDEVVKKNLMQYKGMDADSAEGVAKFSAPLAAHVGISLVLGVLLHKPLAALNGIADGNAGEIRNATEEVVSASKKVKPTPFPEGFGQQNEQGFFSRAEQVVSEKMANAGDNASFNPTEVHAMLKSNGVTDQEIRWTLGDLFTEATAAKRKVTKSELVDALVENKVVVNEIQRGQTGERNALSKQRDALIDEYRRLSRKPSLEPGESLTSIQDELATVDKKLQAIPENRATKWDLETYGSEKLELPGGENPRELQLILPTREGKPVWEVKWWDHPDDPSLSGWRAMTDPASNGMKGSSSEVVPTKERAEEIGKRLFGKLVDPEANFTGGHWAEPNVVSHVRFNDRVGPNGEKILFIEEIQSDWAKGAEHNGIRTAPPEEPFEVFDYTGKASDPPIATFKTQAEAEAFIHNAGEEGKAWDFDNVTDSFDPEIAQMYKDRVPDAPFIKGGEVQGNYLELSMKRMMRWAAENGYDEIAWTTAQQQKDRYRLSKKVDEVMWDKDTNTFRAFKDGNIITDTKITAEELPGTIGGDLAKRLIESQSASEPGQWSRARGVELDLGGKVHNAIYDNQLRNIANKLGKKYGARVGETEIDVTPSDAFSKRYDAVHSIKVTPELRQAALDKGFSVGAVSGSPIGDLGGLVSPAASFGIDQSANDPNLSEEERAKRRNIASMVGLAGAGIRSISRKSGAKDDRQRGFDPSRLSNAAKRNQFKGVMEELTGHDATGRPAGANPVPSPEPPRADLPLTERAPELPATPHYPDDLARLDAEESARFNEEPQTPPEAPSPSIGTSAERRNSELQRMIEEAAGRDMPLLTRPGDAPIKAAEGVDVPDNSLAEDVVARNRDPNLQRPPYATDASEADRLERSLGKYPEEIRPFLREQMGDDGIKAALKDRGFRSDAMAEQQAQLVVASTEEWIRAAEGGKMLNHVESRALAKHIVRETLAVVDLEKRLNGHLVRASATEPGKIQGDIEIRKTNIAALLAIRDGNEAEAARILRSARQDAGELAGIYGLKQPRVGTMSAGPYIVGNLAKKNASAAAISYQLSEFSRLSASGASPIQMAKFWGRIQTPPVGVRDWVRAGRFNAMLSGPRGLLLDTIGDGLELVWRMNRDFASSAYKDLRGKETTYSIPAAAGTTPTTYVRHGAPDLSFPHVRHEFGAEMSGALAGLGQGMKAIGENFFHGISEEAAKHYELPQTLGSRLDWKAAQGDNLTIRGKSPLSPADRKKVGQTIVRTLGVPLANILDIVTKGKQSVDDVARAIGYGMTISRQASQVAEKEGLALGSAAFKARVQAIVSDPLTAFGATKRGVEVMNTAIDASNRMVFKGPMGGLGRWAGAMQGHPLGDFTFPFVQTPYGLGARGIDRSPLGLAATVYDMAKGEYRNPNMKREVVPLGERLFDGVAGSTVSLYLIQQAVFENNITGTGPSDPKERKLLEAKGWRPYSVNFPGFGWRSYENWGPMAISLGMAGQVGDALKYHKPGDDAWKSAIDGVERASLLVQDLTFVSNAIDVGLMLYDPERYFDKGVRGLATTFVPFSGAVRSLAQWDDPYERSTKGDDRREAVVDAVKTVFPKVRQTVNRAQDIFGQDRENKYYGGKSFTPGGIVDIKDRPVADEILRLRGKELDVSIPGDNDEYKGMEQPSGAQYLIRKTIGGRVEVEIKKTMDSDRYKAAKTDEEKAGLLNAASSYAARLGDIELDNQVERTPKGKAQKEYEEIPHYQGVRGSAAEVRRQNYEITRAKSRLSELTKQFNGNDSKAEVTLKKEDPAMFKLTMKDKVDSDYLSDKKKRIEKKYGVTL